MLSRRRVCAAAALCCAALTLGCPSTGHPENVIEFNIHGTANLSQFS